MDRATIIMHRVEWTWDEEDRCCSVIALDENGQTSLVAAEVFGPFDTKRDLANWLWARLILDVGAPLR